LAIDSCHLRTILQLVFTTGQNWGSPEDGHREKEDGWSGRLRFASLTHGNFVVHWMGIPLT